ncbi:NAD-dependent epimerase/dehydratase family protein [Thioalkalivibrio sulfidiphilus]|uniref:NAD-dependent epimerase/dehydratase family protein n=1 Tax=Thioalkalivibrio sulfidiphilus TaxID=1033854 RepID=UPI0003693CC5|nr:NAD-dependent epimerase/dehydratase family protein [Thioalkalivibrio sulfidiphilus]
MKILITGAAGRLARLVLPRLLADERIERVYGVDLQPIPLEHPRLTAVRADIRDPECLELLEVADVLVHMAFVLMGGGLGRARHDRAAVRAVNVAGSHLLMGAAVEAGVGRIVFVSSAAVYGTWPDLPEPVSESQPLRPLPGFSYGEDKAAVETWLDGLEAANPYLHLIRLRPHAILGPNAHPMLLRLLHQPLVPWLSRPLPRTQCVWEDDVAEALHLSLFTAARGAFNLAADPPMPLRDMVRLNRRLTLPVPLALLDLGHRIAWRFSPAVGEPGWVKGLRHSLVLDTRRAWEELGWRARRDTHRCVKYEG